ncbi:MAG TPA: hypothetical protein VFN67_08100 [Polyangiales bacterium]|nr:hypothetical protein [Polyangiales bacterium]
MTSFVFAAIVLLAGIFASRSSVLYWQLALCLFGATAALTLPNGAVITPSNLFLPFLLLRAFGENHGSQYIKRVPAAGVWLGLAALVGIVVAAFIPRFFQGELVVLTVDRQGVGSRPALYPLQPVSTNFTQSVYAVGGVAAFLAFRALLERRGRITSFRDAALLLCALDCAAGVLNLAEFHLGLPSLLSYVRNAYAVFDTYAGYGGLMRIHGTFSEASAYAAFTLPLFAFSFYLWLHGVRALYTGTLAATSGTLLLISTSATAYVGIIMYATMLVFCLIYRSYVRGHMPRLGLILAGALLALVLVGSLFVLETRFGERISDYMSVTLLNKLDSSSGNERSLWNRHAWHNFLDTYGVGVGLGTARASSYALVLLSNLGAIGTVFYLMFLASILRKPDPEPNADEIVCEAAGQAVLAGLSCALVSAAVYDMGLAYYGFAASASLAGAWCRSKPSALPRAPSARDISVRCHV